MIYRVVISATAHEELKGLPKADADRILRKVLRLESGLQGDIKRLQNADVAYRLRMGNYRILFDVVGDRVIIRRVGHRKDVYD